MERIEQPKTAVPLEVQRVLDAMTEENWCKGSYGFSADNGKRCFKGRAFTMGLWSVADRCCDLCFEKTGEYVFQINDRAESLSDFKSKISALYATEA